MSITVTNDLTDFEYAIALQHEFEDDLDNIDEDSELVEFATTEAINHFGLDNDRASAVALKVLEIYNPVN